MTFSPYATDGFHLYTYDQYNNLVKVPRHTGPASSNEPQYAFIENRKVYSDQVEVFCGKTNNECFIYCNSINLVPVRL